jgi:hypothetical protein
VALVTPWRSHRHTSGRASLLFAFGTAHPFDHVGEFGIPSKNRRQRSGITTPSMAALTLKEDLELAEFIVQFFDF